MYFYIHQSRQLKLTACAIQVPLSELNNFAFANFASMLVIDYTGKKWLAEKEEKVHKSLMSCKIETFHMQLFLPS